MARRCNDLVSQVHVSLGSDGGEVTSLFLTQLFSVPPVQLSFVSNELVFPLGPGVSDDWGLGLDDNWWRDDDDLSDFAHVVELIVGLALPIIPLVIVLGAGLNAVLILVVIRLVW